MALLTGCAATTPPPAPDTAVTATAQPQPGPVHAAEAVTSDPPPQTPAAQATEIQPSTPSAAIPKMQPETKQATGTKSPVKSPAKPVTPAPASAPSPAPGVQPMALSALEQRLKDTPAIGVFTKLTLKNQVDELVGRFRAHYEGRGSITLAQLRLSYEQLLARVQGLLKDGDPGLASAIAHSREAIWAVLTDPVQFAKL